MEMRIGMPGTERVSVGDGFSTRRHGDTESGAEGVAVCPCGVVDGASGFPEVLVLGSASRDGVPGGNRSVAGAPVPGLLGSCSWSCSFCCWPGDSPNRWLNPAST